jgi:uncharacterized lipoprotein NlpE involved in copper resistance
MATVEDKFKGAAQKSNIAFGDLAETITPHDINVLTKAYKYIAAGATAGTVRCIDRAGTTTDWYLQAGQPLPFRPHRILATGTTATPLNGVVE